MRPSDIALLIAHLEAVQQHHPVATLVDGSGATFAGDLVSFGGQDIVVCDPVTKRATQLHLPSAAVVRVIALGQPPATFGAMADEEPEVP